MLWHFLAMVAGAAVVARSADLLVRGGSRLAAALGVPTVLVGLTVVAYGTSAPEALVSVMSVAHGAGALAVGNVLGSNVANLALILGAAALLRPLDIDPRVGRIDGPMVIAATLAVAAMGLDGTLGRVDGLLLLAGALAYTLACVRGVRGAAAEQDDAEPISRPLESLYLLGGLLGLLLGANLLVGGAVTIARALGISELLIGATVVAIGTSLPELAASVAAARADDHGLAVGNVVGSNLFNLLLVLGLAATVGEIPVPRPALLFDLLPGLMLAAALVAFGRAGRALERRHGLALLAAFALYMATCVARAGGS